MEFSDFKNHIEKIYNLVQDLTKLNSKHIEYLNSYIIEFKKHDMMEIAQTVLDKDSKEFAFTQPNFTRINDVNERQYQVTIREDFTTCLVLLSLLGSKHSINEIEKRLEAKIFSMILIKDYCQIIKFGLIQRQDL